MKQTEGLIEVNEYTPDLLWDKTIVDIMSPVCRSSFGKPSPKEQFVNKYYLIIYKPVFIRVIATS